MLKFLARDVVCFDTETVPDAEAGRRMYGYNSEVEDMFREHPDYDAKTNPRPFLKPILTRVVSIALVRRVVGRSDGPPVELKVIQGDGEKTLIRKFLTGLGSNNCQLVGFNSEGFDLPLLIQRALVHGLSIPAFCKRPDKPWEGRDLHARYSDWHIDLMHELGGFGRSVPSLSEACAALNILGGAKDISGADVLDLHLAGDQDAINRYCATDAVRHFLILLRLCVLAGHISQEQATREEADVIAQLDALTAPPTAQEEVGQTRQSTLTDAPDWARRAEAHGGDR